MTLPLREGPAASGSSETLDPENWDEIRAQGHRMLDDMIDYVATIRERPVWRPIPDEVRARFRAELPRQACDLGEVYREFADFIAPYATGNVHPGFMGWVHGGGTAVGMLAEMLAAGLNANLGGRDHVPIEVERQIVEWTRAMFGFPRRGERNFRHGNVDGEPDGGIGGANGGAGTNRQAARRRRRRRAADGLYLDRRAWLRREGDGPRRLRQRCAAMHRRSIDRTVSTWRRCARRSPAIARPV